MWFPFLVAQFIVVLLGLRGVVVKGIFLRQQGWPASLCPSAVGWLSLQLGSELQGQKDSKLEADS